MNVWEDNRTSPLGQAAGNIVLRELLPAGQAVERLNGTTFIKGNLMLVCRVAGHGYLAGKNLHWCNLSRREHELRLEAAHQQGRTLVYVFITIRPTEPVAVEYWVIPGEVMGCVLAELPITASGQSSVHIVARDNVHRIGEHDVTQFHCVAALKRRDRALLKHAQLGSGEQMRTPARAPARRRATPLRDTPMIVNVRHGARCYVGVARLAVDGD